MRLEDNQKESSRGLDAMISYNFYPITDGEPLENFEENLHSFLIAFCSLTASLPHSTSII